MSLYLGLDSSTQSLTAIVIDTDTGRLVYADSLNFGKDLPAYQSPNGFLAHPDPLIKHADPRLWLAALDLLLARAKMQGFSWSHIAAVSGSGQQHGSVYLREPVTPADPAADLPAWLAPRLARPSAPIWMDASTTAECAEIEAALGGAAELTRRTGSRAIARFTGPQIRAFAKREPQAYAQTRRIHLVSSFLASVLAGQDAPIDFGDGAGMNLLHLARGDWDEELLAATAPGLRAKLPPAAPSDRVVGSISPYFVRKYGFKPDTKVVAWSGDNPCSLIGMGASAPGTAVISLGTSDTFFAAMSHPLTDPRGFGHVFGNPAGGFMSLVCFQNGSLAREAVAKRFNLDWEQFTDAILRQTRPGNDGKLMLPYFGAETTPRLARPELRLLGPAAFRAWEDAPGAARAVVEAQALSMRLHTDWIGEKTTRLLVTGGAARNAGVLQVLADVLGAPLQRLAAGVNSAALGAALRAANAVGGFAWSDLEDAFCAPESAIVEPTPGLESIYAELSERLRAELQSCA